MSHSGESEVVRRGMCRAPGAFWRGLALDTGQYMCHGPGANSDLLIEIDRHSYARFNDARSYWIELHVLLAPET